MITGQYRCSPLPLGKVISSIGALLSQRARSWPEHPVLGFRAASDDYVLIKWRSFLDDVASLACFLDQKGIAKGDRLAVFSPNSYQMLVWEMAVTSMGAISVPIFAGYDAKNVDYILGHAEPKAIYVDGEKRLEKVHASSAAKGIPLVITRQQSPHTLLGDSLRGGSRKHFSELVRRVKSQDVCFIQYTSGTTGKPKGVMLTHRNIMSQRKGMSQVWEIPYRSRFLSYLPWHHSFGGLFERFAALHHGATIYLEDSYGKDINRLIENWEFVKPTQFFSVPKIYVALVTEARADPAIHRAVFHRQLQFVFTAAAPLPRECAEYFKSQQVPVVEGWGLTETAPLVTFTPFGQECPESCVGEPIAGCEILITPDSEILTRGPNLMKGYFKDEERTAKVIDPLGWFHTGDLGELTDGGLRMICRMDGLFKLSNGEKVSSMMVENAITVTSTWIQHALAVGTARDFVSAIVFPNLRSIERWAKEKGKQLPAGWELSKDKEIQDLVAAEITGNMADFRPKYMRVQAFVIIPTELSLEGGELTPSMKVIRDHVLDKYKDWWEAIYDPANHPDKAPFVVSLQ